MQEFGVKAVAKYTGINPHTLRVWERRFDIVVPNRTPTGRRVYSKADADKLCLIALLLSKGHSISALAKLTAAELTLAASNVRNDPNRGNNVPDPKEAAADARINDQIVRSLENFRLQEISSQLSLARMQTSSHHFVFAIVLPLIRRIGVLVEEDGLSVAHEHALSAILKTHIYQSIYSVSATLAAQGENKNAAITIATQEGDFHEFGILIATLLAMSRQLPIHFLGCNIPAKSLAFATNALRAKIVLVGKTLPSVTSAQGVLLPQKAFLKELDAALRPDIEIWIGGHVEAGATQFKSRHPIKVLSTLEELDRKLASL